MRSQITIVFIPRAYLRREREPAMPDHRSADELPGPGYHARLHSEIGLRIERRPKRRHTRDFVEAIVGCSSVLQAVSSITTGVRSDTRSTRSRTSALFIPVSGSAGPL